MLTLPFAAVLALASPAMPSCIDLPATSTMADQFTCYKDAGRKIVVPGTGFVDGFDGPGCITGVWADRIQVGTCSSFNRRTVTVPFATLRAVEDIANSPYVTLILETSYAQVDCAVVNCVQVVERPAPAPSPQVQTTRRFALPRKP